MKTIMIFYDWFIPAYKAGGPIPAIANLIRNTSGSYKYFIVCRDTEYGSNEHLSGVVSNRWVDFEGKASVIYLAKQSLKTVKIKALLREISPDIIIVNGLYSLYFSLIPIIYSKTKTIISVIGMLHPGALSQKSWKKKPFLLLFKLLTKKKDLKFHATDEIEKKHIYAALGNVSVKVAGCFPNIFNYVAPFPKITKTIFVSVALISAMKNHQLVLQAFRDCTSLVEYNIYGPIKDVEYWEGCKKLIKDLPKNVSVRYGGEVNPSLVPEKLGEAHFFILPSKSENFGYAFIEALSIGRPVVTSNFTPWNNLEEAKAGFNVNINNTSYLSEAIKKCCQQDDEEYKVWSKSSRNYALLNMDFATLHKQYANLYSA